MHFKIGAALLLLLSLNNLMLKVKARRRSLIDEDKYLVSESNDNKEQGFDTSRYKFAYGVEDHKTGDFKMHQEERNGDLVKGQYTVADADGTLRTVRYTADKHNGFHAVISKAGSPHQEVLPMPAASTQHQRSIKVPSTNRYSHNNHKLARHFQTIQSSVSNSNEPNDNYHQENQDGATRQEGRYTDTPLPIPNIKKYYQEMPQFAKNYVARHNANGNKNYPTHFDGSDTDEDAHSHYQSINIDNNSKQTRYTLKLRPQPEQPQLQKPQPKPAVLVEYQQMPVFRMQKPQGFRMHDNTNAHQPEAHPVAMPLTMTPGPGPEEDHHDHDDEDHVIENYHTSQIEQPQEQHSETEVPLWQQHDPQGRSEKHLNAYKQIFEQHFGKLRKSQDITPGQHGAYSYMNYEGETSGSYNLHHNHNMSKKKQ